MSELIQLDQVGVKQPPSEAEFHRERVADLLSLRTKAFPGAQPVSFAKKHYKALQEADYYLCEKTDGIRCLLYLSFYVENNEKVEAAFLVDRKNDYYHIRNQSFHMPLPVPKTWPQAFHTDTLLDGELVIDVENGERIPRYLVFDCLALDGMVLLNRTLDKRIAYFTENVLKPYERLLRDFPEEKSEQPFEVRSKKMEKAYGLRMLFTDILPNLPHGNDGLVFTRVDTPYVIGTDQNIIKWKPPQENTIDFKLQLGAFPPLSPDDGMNGASTNGHAYEPDYDACPAMDLLVHKGGNKDDFFANLYVTDEEWTAMKSLNQMLDHRIIECYKDSQSRWRFKKESDGTPRFRDDKTNANFITTVESVLESIEDAVSQNDLLSLDMGIKAAWKEREDRAKERMRREEAARRQAEEAKRKAQRPQ